MWSTQRSMQIPTSILANTTSICWHFIKLPSTFPMDLRGLWAMPLAHVGLITGLVVLQQTTPRPGGRGHNANRAMNFTYDCRGRKKLMWVFQEEFEFQHDNIPDMANPPNLSISIYVPLSLPHSQYPHKSVRGNTNTLCVCQQWSFLVEWKSCF